MFHVRSGPTARENWHGQKLCPRKSKSLHEICNWIVLFLKIIASLVAVVLLLHPFSFSFFTVFTTLSFLLVLYNYLLHTCFLYSFGVHILSSLFSLSTFVLWMFSYSIQSLKFFICYSTLFFYLLLHIQLLSFFLLSQLSIFFYLLSFIPVQSQATFAQTKPTQFCSLWSVTSAPVQTPEITWSQLHLEISRADGTGRTKHGSLSYVAYTTECAFLSKQESKRP